MNKKQMTVLFAVCAFAASLSQAAVVTWDGGVGNWDDANWTVDGTSSTNATLADTSATKKTTDQYTIGSGTVTRTNGLTLGNAGGSLTLGSGATLDITGGFLNFAPNSSGLIQGTVNASAQLTTGETTGAAVINGGDVTASYAGISVLGAKIVAQSGSLTLTSNNGFRFSGANLDGGALIDFTGGAGSFTITQNDNTLKGRELAAKAVAGFFGINGTQVSTATSYGVTNLPTVNAELQAAAVDGLYFQITENAGTQTLSIVQDVIPGTPVDLSIATAPGGVELSFLSTSNIAYLIETTSDLTDTNSWTTLTNVNAVTDETTVAVDTTGEPVAFFRAEMQ